MPESNEQRRHQRSRLSPPRLGIVNLETEAGGSGTPALFVDVCSLSRYGALVESLGRLAPSARLDVQIFDSLPGEWQGYHAQVVWVESAPQHRGFAAGLELLHPLDFLSYFHRDAGGKQRPGPADLEFLLGTSLMRQIPRRAFCPLLNCFTPLALEAGERLMAQGDPGKAMYIIQEGVCAVKLDKDDVSHTIARLGPGELVGEMAVLTGEVRSANVDALEDMKLWCLERDSFDQVAAVHPEVRAFLTELVTDRLESTALSADRTIGRYVIRHKIGQGGWSLVYQGEHLRLKMPVAIKMLKHSLAMDEDFLDNFRHEAEIIARLNHRNIVRVYDIEELFRTQFIIMEYLEGRSLEELLSKQGPLEPQAAADILGQVAGGLHYAHGQGIIHQDIKPANLFLLSGGAVKILDFGLACAQGEEDLDLTGTLQYMAPEQVRGQAVSPATDAYGLGITAYELLTGQRPYPEDDLGELARLRVSQDIPDPRSKLPGLPQAMARFILKCCRRDPEQRYQSLAQAQMDLASMASQAGAPRPGSEGKRMTSVHLFYDEGQQVALNRLLEELSEKAEELGVTLKAAEFKDL